MTAAVNIYLSTVFWWLAFPVAAVTFAVALHGVGRLAVRCWRDRQSAKLWNDFDKTGAGVRGLLGTTTRKAANAGPRTPFDQDAA